MTSSDQVQDIYQIGRTAMTLVFCRRRTMRYMLRTPSLSRFISLNTLLLADRPISFCLIRNRQLATMTNLLPCCIFSMGRAGAAELSLIDKRFLSKLLIHQGVFTSALV
jgi:hypothetical protein